MTEQEPQKQPLPQVAMSPSIPLQDLKEHPSSVDCPLCNVKARTTVSRQLGSGN